MRILVIEDQPKLACLLADSLKAHGFKTDLAGALEQATDFVAVTNYDAILLDRGLPDGDGLDWLQNLRKQGDVSPVLFMSAERYDTDDRVAGLDAGADDYIVKPFEIVELLARLRAVLRRPSSALDPVLSAGNLQFDPASRQVWVEGAEIHIPRREACLLESLIRRFGRVVPKAALEESLYSFDDEVSPNAIEVGVYRLRSHLQNANATIVVRTARGVGYALEDAEGAAAAPRKEVADEEQGA